MQVILAMVLVTRLLRTESDGAAILRVLRQILYRASLSMQKVPPEFSIRCCIARVAL